MRGFMMCGGGGGLLSMRRGGLGGRRMLSGRGMLSSCGRGIVWDSVRVDSCGFFDLSLAGLRSLGLSWLCGRL